jgi:DNA-binding GntR family transcriptional regulator
MTNLCSGHINPAHFLFNAEPFYLVNCLLQIVDNLHFYASIQGMNAALHPTIAQLQNSSLTTVVQQEIERAILAGEYEPGSKLIEATLAEKMGVSRGPVREAFRMLEEAGLVRTEKNRGVFVRDIPIDEAVEIFDLRAAMDELVGRRLAENSTPAQVKELKALVDSMEKAVKAEDPHAYHLLNLTFHDRWSKWRATAS